MKTLALVIGNNNYSGGNVLKNAINDAKAISEVFKRLNYDVIYKEDLKSIDCGSILSMLNERMNNTDSFIFYFAGHGYQFDGENYLLATDCPISFIDKHICGYSSIKLSEILSIIEKSQTKINIIIIDACRGSISGDRGSSNYFSPVIAPKGTIIAFSTSPGKGAKDSGMDGHSLYTGALLKYIGIEALLVEELFKKVRKMVSILSDGAQTTWEHTSLVGDFYFNTGQMIFSVSIPYDESVVKDRNYITKGDEIDSIVSDLKSCNWDLQNPAMDRFRALDPRLMNKNQQFIIGRNILQAGGFAHNAINFLKDLSKNLILYNIKNENHILNGILYEIYFDSNGDFRNGGLKKESFEEVFLLRYISQYKSSFDFIVNVLAPFKEKLFYIPSVDKIIDVIVKVNTEEKISFFDKSEELQVIESICVNDKDITIPISMLYKIGNLVSLKKTLSTFLVVPIKLIHITTNIEITKHTFKYDVKKMFPDF